MPCYIHLSFIQYPAYHHTQTPCRNTRPISKCPIHRCSSHRLEDVFDWQCWSSNMPMERRPYFTSSWPIRSRISRQKMVCLRHNAHDARKRTDHVVGATGLTLSLWSLDSSGISSCSSISPIESDISSHFLWRFSCGIWQLELYDSCCDVPRQAANAYHSWLQSLCLLMFMSRPYDPNKHTLKDFGTRL